MSNYITVKNSSAFFITAIIFLFSLLQSSDSARSSSRSIDPEIQVKIDEFIQHVYLPASQTSGLGLTIVQNDGEILYTTGYGKANLENGIPNGNSTQFLIGSITKSFTSVLIVKLLHEKFPSRGEAVLDTPIIKLLPQTQANFTLSDRFRSEHATFRDLLAHRLCLSRGDVQLVADPFNTTEEIVYRTRYIEEICGMRGEFQYSNQMYVVAGQLAGLLANKTYEDAMQDLLNEIGMLNTTFTQKTDNFTKMPSRALPYYVKDNKTFPINPELVKRVNLYNAVGGLFVPPNDMAIYMKFLLNLGNINGTQIVPPEVMEWLTKPSIALPSSAFKKSEDDLILSGSSYGLGLLSSSYDGWSCIQHSGYFTGYSSLMTLYPDKNRLGIFSSLNMGPVMASQQALHVFIFETLRGSGNALGIAMDLHQKISLAQEMQKEQAKQQFQAFYQGLVDKLEGMSLVNIIGSYGNGNLGDVHITEKLNDKTAKPGFYLEYGRWVKGWLQEAAGKSLFNLVLDTDVIQDSYALGSYDVNSTFVAFDNGTMSIFSSTGNNEKTELEKFKLGVSLDELPPIPWSPESCGPEGVV